MNLFFHNTKANKYSINSLSFVVEDLKDLKVRFFYEISEIENIINKKETDIFVFSFMTPFYEKEKKLSIYLKTKYPKSLTIAGGPHIYDKNSSEISNHFDYVFIGEGEETFKEFIKNLTNGLLPKNKVIKNFKNIDINSYQSVSDKFKRFGSIEITRGCPYSCFYCQNPFNMGKIQRHKKIENIIKEIEILLKNDFTDIRFVTPDLASYGSVNGKDLNLKEFESLVNETNKAVKGKGRVFLGSFPSEIRPEHITEDIVKILKGKTSAKRIIIGGQSGSDEILKKINRAHTSSDIIKAVSILRKNDIEADVDFIFGFPFETEKDLNESKKIIEILTQKYSARIHLHYFMPLPNTPFENLKPKPIDLKTRRFLSSLTSKNIAFGQWENQIRLGHKS